MNIFEKYGSYEAVKQAAVNYKNSGDMVTAAGLELQCLEYRRQNNIFDVGDKVVTKNEPFWPEEYAIQVVERIDVGRWYMSAWRHATDEEIAAGKRL